MSMPRKVYGPGASCPALREPSYSPPPKPLPEPSYSPPPQPLASPPQVARVVPPPSAAAVAMTTASGVSSAPVPVPPRFCRDHATTDRRPKAVDVRSFKCPCCRLELQTTYAELALCPPCS